MRPRRDAGILTRDQRRLRRGLKGLEMLFRLLELPFQSYYFIFKVVFGPCRYFVHGHRPSEL